jgi:hypothetical protein
MGLAFLIGIENHGSLRHLDGIRTEIKKMGLAFLTGL